MQADIKIQKQHQFPDLLTSEEVAELLKVTPQTVGNYIRQGDLPAYRVGRSHRIAQSDLIHFLSQNRATVSPPSGQAALILKQKSGAKLILKTTAEFLIKNLPPNQYDSIAIAYDDNEYSLKDFVNQPVGNWQKRALKS